MPVIPNPTPYLPLAGGTLQGHLSVSSPVPGAVAGANAGGGPPAPVVTTGTTDSSGIITFGTGLAPAAGGMVNVTFGTPWVIPGGGAPGITLSPLNAATQALGLYVSSLSPVGFTISVAVAPAASQGNTTYSVGFVAIG